MREKNEKVYKLIKHNDGDTVDAHKVMNSDWLPHFVPLTISEIKNLWVDFNKQQLNLNSLKKLQRALFFLYDKDQLSFSEISGDGFPPFVYPMSVAQVFVQPEFDWDQQFRRTTISIIYSIKDFADDEETR